MTMDFYTINLPTQRYHITNRGWRLVYTLAQMYGWEPQGTLPRDDWDKMLMGHGIPPIIILILVRS